MPAKMVSRGSAPVNSIGFNTANSAEYTLTFTDLYLLLLNNQTLVEAELLELHRLILKKLTHLKPPACN
jgi:hypothetical protein